VLFPVIRLSQGTAACLGFKKIRMDAAPTTAYLLYGGRCQMSCAFCLQARGNGASGTINRLGRITWPPFSQQELLACLPRAAPGGLKRICIQGVKSAAGNAELLQFVEEVKAVSTLPLCVSTWVESEEEVDRLFAAGVERVSIALDAVNPLAYASFKKGSLQRRSDLLLNCARLWPGRMSTHIIVGLMETEEECVTLLEKLLQGGIRVALFAFTPLKGTALAAHPAPPLDTYRRIQAAHFLLQKQLISLSDLRFLDGRIQSFGLPVSLLQDYLQGGAAFQTSGCPDCNRPYYNERPGGVMYNFPRPLTGAEVKEAIQCVSGADGKDVSHGRTLAGHL
jgi:lipoyl synthase